MSPSDFKNRYAVVRNVANAEFVIFPAVVSKEMNITASDRMILTESGLPRQAAPFLSFGFFKRSELLLQPLDIIDNIPKSLHRYRMIGQTGNGDMICIDDIDGSVVFLNHDQDMSVVFINSSVTALAAALCVYAECRKLKDAVACRNGFQEIDPASLADGGFWPMEIKRLERIS